MSVLVRDPGLQLCCSGHGGPKAGRRTASQLRRPWLRWLIPAMVILFVGAACVAKGQVTGATELMQQGRFHDAEVALRNLVRQHPQNASLRSDLGVALAQQGELAAAAKEYRASLALDPNQPTVQILLGLAEFKQGHFKEAIPAFKIAMKALPKDDRSTVLLGMSYFGLRQYGE